LHNCFQKKYQYVIYFHGPFQLETWTRYDQYLIYDQTTVMMESHDQRNMGGVEGYYSNGV